MKRYINSSLLYSVLGIIGGVFYREFTKLNGFTGVTVLSGVHAHYFTFGTVFFLLLLILAKNFSFQNAKTGRILIAYHIGLNITACMFIARGVTQVLDVNLSSGVSASISGIAGIGHISLGVSIILLLCQIKRSVLQISAN